jgi:hypothetical protein
MTATTTTMALVYWAFWVARRYVHYRREHTLIVLRGVVTQRKYCYDQGDELYIYVTEQVYE